MKFIYCWNNDTHTVEEYLVEDPFATSFPEEIAHKYALDTRYDEPENRYGMGFLHDYGHHWEHIPLRMFPKQFQLALLVLGVK